MDEEQQEGAAQPEQPERPPKGQRAGTEHDGRRHNGDAKRFGEAHHRPTLVEQPDRTPDPNQPGQDIYHRWLPGHTHGHPSSRLRKEIVRQTEGGQKLVEWVIRLWMGEITILTALGRTAFPTFEDRRWAVEWLTERGWGKPQVSVDVAGPAVVVIQNGGDVE